MDNRYETGSRAIQRSLLLAAGVNSVYELLSEGRGLEQWLCSRVLEEPHRDLEGRRVLHLEWDLQGRVDRIDIAVLEEQDPPQRVEAPASGSPGPCAARFGLRWQAEWPKDSIKPPGDTIATFALYPEGPGTRLVFNETGFGDGPEWDYALNDQSRGWDGCFVKLMQVAGSQSTRVIERSIPLSAAGEDVWAALTDPKHIAQWFEPCEVWDARQGGNWKIVHELHGTGQGRFMYCESGKLLSLTWQWYTPGIVLVPTWVEFALAPAPGGLGTLLTIRHGGWGTGAEWDHEYADHDRGWVDCLAALDAYLQSQQPLSAAGGAS